MMQMRSGIQPLPITFSATTQPGLHSWLPETLKGPLTGLPASTLPMCLFLSSSKDPVNTQVNSYLSSAQNLSWLLSSWEKSQTPHCGQQGPFKTWLFLLCPQLMPLASALSPLIPDLLTLI